jgi:8-oxo-dGTP pyrophosphatase MutT (NUDIX family)
VVDHPQPTVLLTQRSAHLSSHAGQISFPGGKIDATDASPLDAALREAQEEVGLNREFIEPIGYLDLYGTALGFRILPTVARVKPGFKLQINEGEVGRRLRGAARLPDESGESPDPQQGIPRHGAFILRDAVRGALHLGATAGILRVLYERIYQP